MPWYMTASIPIPGALLILDAVLVRWLRRQVRRP